MELDIIEVELNGTKYQLREFSFLEAQAYAKEAMAEENDTGKTNVEKADAVYRQLIAIVAKHIIPEMQPEEVSAQMGRAKIVALHRALIEYSGQELKPMGEVKAVATIPAKSAVA